jgi:putative transposase
MLYHVFNKSIAGFNIFNSDKEYRRMTDSLPFYQSGKRCMSFSRFIRDRQIRQMEAIRKKDRIVDIVAYCIMPTHVHFMLKEYVQGGITDFTRNVLNSYSHYFNLKHKRKGPLWESRSKKVLMKTDGQLIHVTRYIHLNPVTAYLANKPEDWPYSSYGEYIARSGAPGNVCVYEDLIDMKPHAYAEFVNDRISYQRELVKIKHLLLE